MSSPKSPPNSQLSGWRRTLLFLFALVLATLAGLVGGVFGGRLGGAALPDLSLSAQFHSHWDHSADEARAFARKNSERGRFKAAAFATRNLSFDRIRREKAARFNLSAADVLVFLHVQKTGGTTLEKFLTRHLDLATPCRCSPGRKRCQCPRSDKDGTHWLFSRFSTGWSCGLHADWTELVTSNCVDNVLDKKDGGARKRRYFFTTLLRDPVARYISEFRHVQRGATWLSSPHVCNGRPASAAELPACYDPDLGWDDVSLDEFLDCPHNLANNRMTRMLADLTLVGCYDESRLTPEKRAAVLLESAKTNLASMAFFGLLEKLGQTQTLFERLFRLKFKKSLSGTPHSTKSSVGDVSAAQMSEIRARNALDLELYAFAARLFEERARGMGIADEAGTPDLQVDEED